MLSSLRKQGEVFLTSTPPLPHSFCSQSISREFAPQGIHVCHIVIDGLISSQQALDFFGMPKGSNFRQGYVIRPEEAAKTWLFIAQQDTSGWISELEVRPSQENF